MAEQNCAHEDCECMVQDGDGVAKGEDTYCSKYCANSRPADSSEECQCGHEECV